MSLRIKHLNADSSFLLIFSPPGAPPNNNGSFPGSFTILVDAWLTGSSITLSPKFAHTRHTIEPAVFSLAHLPEPDVVIVSQDKDDHCHRETLTTLPSTSKTMFLGPSAAAKKIRSWKYFDPTHVHALPRYESTKPDTIYRISIPTLDSSESPGEVTITLMAPAIDVTGLHNAIGLTYTPPSKATDLFTPSISCIDLPLTPPASPPQSPLFSIPSTLAPRISRPLMRPGSASSPARSFTSNTSDTSDLATLTPQISHPQLDLQSIKATKTLSIIYSPHGLPYAPHIQSYATNHLLKHNALPLTALLHAFDSVTNPWYLGGNITTGSQGGLEIARSLGARVWISAHDEDKVSSGLSVKQTRTVKCNVQEVQRLLAAADDEGERRRHSPSGARHRSKSAGLRTMVLDLDAGEDYYYAAK